MARLIDANALKEIFDNRYDDAFMQAHVRANIAWWEGYCGGVNWARNTLADTNAVDAAEVVHGRWGIIGGDLHSNGYPAVCTVCNKAHFVHYKKSLGGLNLNELFELPKYCPNCGAKMDGDGNG